MKRDWVERTSVLWVLFWGAVALDSAMVSRRSREAIEKAVDADPIVEMYEGPPEQHARVNRWLLWRSPTLGRLRELCKRADMWKSSAPWIALAGPPLLFALGLRRGEKRA
jgi:hypothetical protein